MKKLLLSLLLATGWIASSGQQITLTSTVDSTYYNCSTPIYVNFMVTGTASGYSAGDSITITVETGDGTILTDKVAAAGQFYSFPFHTYTTHGNYNVKYKASMPGAADSLYKPNEVLAAVCDTLFGKVFYDQNGNCTFDVGEMVLPNMQVGLIAPGDSHVSMSAYSNINGDYSFGVASGSNLYTLNHAGSSNCGTNGSSVSVPSTINIPLSSPVGFSYGNASVAGTICTGGNISIWGGYYHSGLAPNDSIYITAHFGDGTSTSLVRSQNQQGNFNVSHAYTTPGTYTPWFTLSAGGYTDTLMFQNPVVVAICGNVNGVVYNDLDQDCTQDAGEPGISGMHLLAFNGPSLVGSAVSGTNGAYSISLPTGPTYTIMSSTYYTNGFTVNCPATGSHSVSTFPSTNDFAMVCNQQFDLSVAGTSPGIIPGMPATFYLVANDQNCMVAGTGTLTIDFDQTHLPIDSFSVTPSSVNGNLISWNFTSTPFNVRIYARADTLLQLGDSLCFPLSVTPVTGDGVPGNNNYNLCRVVVASYDPNMKEGWTGVGQYGLIKQNTTLDYTIHFQNTGTSPAMNIYLRDTLPAGLDPSTLQILSASHPFTWSSWQGNQLKFEFNNINLPDSNSNEPASKGYVIYRIKTMPNLPNGTVIRNGAAIFFDYNAPVITNKTLHTIDIFLGTQEHAGDLKASFYPNPAHDIVNIDFENEHGTLRVYNFAGAEVKTQVLVKGYNQVQTEGLPAGVYFFSIRSGEKSLSGKIVKQ